MSEYSDSDCQEEEEEIYDVEAIRKWRYNRATKRKEFLIKWRNYPEDENTWEPESNLNCREKMDQFIDGLSRRERRRFNRKDLVNLNGLERNADIVAIEGDKKIPKVSMIIQSGLSTTERIPTDDRSPFVLMVAFEDDEENAEELTLDQLYQHEPEKAFEWIEQRLVAKGN